MKSLLTYRHVKGRRRTQRASRWQGSCIVSLLFACASSVPAVAAEPYLPKNDNEILEHLSRVLLAGQNELPALRKQLSSDPNNAALASDVATRYLQIGKQSGDPRYYGYARAAISHWWEDSSPPTSILKVRAKLKDRNHEYDFAIADLKLLLEKEPQSIQAWIELSNIYRVQGKYAQVQKVCDSLSKFAGQVPVTLCRAPLQAVTGEAQAAYDSLVNITPTVQKQFPSAMQWILTMQAKVSRALGNEQQAEQHYQAALGNAPDDKYLMRAYADFLLDNHREEEALQLLHEHTEDTGVLLRAAIAAQRCGKERLSQEWAGILKIRFEELRLRGSQPHGRYEARYTLELMNAPQRALALALANWQQQKETRDTRNVLEAAIAAKDSAAVQPVLDFLKDHGNRNVILQKLADQLERY